MIFIIVLAVLHHAEYGSATKNTVKPTVSTSASTRKEPVSLGLVGGFIALSVVVLIGVVLSIIIICRMKRKIKNLKAMKCLTHGGEVGQAFERKTDDNLHDKKENVNEQRDLLEKNARKKDTNLKQPPKHSERRNRTDEIINPNPLAESLEAEVQNILEEEKVQEGDDNDTGDYPDLSALPKMDEPKIQTNDFKGSSAKTVKFDNSVTVDRNESDKIKDQDACREKEKEFTEMMNKIVTIDVNLPSHVDADVSESELYEEYDNENKLHEVERGITKMSKENECVDEEEALYESYDYSSGENKGTTKYTTTILKKPFNRKGKSIPPDDADMIEEFVYEESQTGETDPKNTNQGDVLLKTANSLQYYDEALYEEPVSSNFRDSGLPNFPAPDIPNVPMLSMTLLNKSGKALKTDAGKLHMINEDFSNENVTKSINGNGESNQKAERSVSYITASTPSPEPPNVPKRKRQVAPNSPVSPSE